MESVEEIYLIDEESQTPIYKKKCCCNLKCICAWLCGIFWTLFGFGCCAGVVYGIIKYFEYSSNIEAEFRSKNFYISERELLKCIVMNENISDSTDTFINITRDCLLNLTTKSREYHKNKN